MATESGVTGLEDGLAQIIGVAELHVSLPSTATATIRAGQHGKFDMYDKHVEK